MYTVTNPDQARALTNVECIGYLHTFIGAERTVSEAAQFWNLRLDAAYYRVAHLERLGLIEVRRVTKRRGRDLKHYRAIADAFFIPLDIVPEMALDVFIDRADQHFSETMQRAQARAIHQFLSHQPAGHWGMRIARDEHGQPDAHLADRFGNDPNLNDPQMPLVADGWPQLELDHGDAKAFQAELVGLMHRYSGRRGARKYLFHFAFAPLED